MQKLYIPVSINNMGSVIHGEFALTKYLWIDIKQTEDKVCVLSIIFVKNQEQTKIKLNAKHFDLVLQLSYDLKNSWCLMNSKTNAQEKIAIKIAIIAIAFKSAAESSEDKCSFTV